jgi:hypothetical protein
VPYVARADQKPSVSSVIYIHAKMSKFAHINSVEIITFCERKCDGCVDK